MTELFKSDFFTVDLSDSPVVKGHLEVKNNKPLSLCSDEDVNLFFSATSQCATALFELIGAHGTNIFIQEKNNSLHADILARMQNDGLDFLWQPTKADPVQLDSIAKSIKDAIDVIVWKKDNPDGDKNLPSKTEVISEKQSESDGEKINYLFKKLRRTP